MVTHLGAAEKTGKSVSNLACSGFVINSILLGSLVTKASLSNKYYNIVLMQREQNEILGLGSLELLVSLIL